MMEPPASPPPAMSNTARPPSSPKNRPPQTPCKKRPLPLFSEAGAPPVKRLPEDTLYQRILAIHRRREICFEGKICQLKPTEMKGDFHVLYSTPERDDVYVKVLHLDAPSHLKSARISHVVNNIFQQYRELREASLPIINILNVETVQQDGYWLVERLERFVLPWDKATPKEEINWEVLEQMKAFFRYAFSSSSELPLDLKPENFGYRDDRLVLLDFREEQEDDFSVVASQCLRNCSKENRFVMEELLLLIPEELRKTTYKYVWETFSTDLGLASRELGADG